MGIINNSELGIPLGRKEPNQGTKIFTQINKNMGVLEKLSRLIKTTSFSRGHEDFDIEPLQSLPKVGILTPM